MLLRCQLPVSEEGRGRWTQNIPNEDFRFIRPEIVRDEVGVNWNVISETPENTRLRRTIPV